MKFGIEPAKVDDGLIELLKSEESAASGSPARLFNSGERVRLTGGNSQVLRASIRCPRVSGG